MVFIRKKKGGGGGAEGGKESAQNVQLTNIKATKY